MNGDLSTRIITQARGYLNVDPSTSDMSQFVLPQSSFASSSKVDTARWQ